MPHMWGACVKFIQHIENLKTIHYDEIRYTPNHTCLIGRFPEKSDLASKHRIQAPMPQEALQYLKDTYKQKVPTELIEIYHTANGCNLCSSLVHVGEYWIPNSRLDIYGIPIGSPYDDLEPYNISVEDCSRPHNVPKTWLKFGSYSEIYHGTIQGQYDLFVDVVDGMVSAVPMRAKKVNLKNLDNQWDSIDRCLCSLLEHALSCMEAD